MSGHIVIDGTTESGKTTLARSFCAELRAAGTPTLVCDPLHGNWPCDWRTPSIEAFYAKARRSAGCGLFIDEGGQTINRNADYQWFFTTARHFGHRTFVMIQYAAQLLPVMRVQCSRLFLFRSDEGAAELWARTMTQPSVRKLAPELKQYEFLVVSRFEPVRRCKLKLPDP